MDRTNGPTDGRDETRQQLLALGLADLIHLSEIYAQIAHDNPGMTAEQVQCETAETTSSLVGAGLFDIGDLSGPPESSRPGDLQAPGTFVAWKTIPLDELSIVITSAYARDLVDSVGWNWMLWLRLTELGKSIARKENRRSRFVTAVSGIVGSGRRPHPFRRRTRQQRLAHAPEDTNKPRLARARQTIAQ